MTAPATAKSEQTRAQIVDAALRLFRERGYEGTTMRSVAEEAGVSVGNAYYYFRSKDELVQGFYDQLAADHRAASAKVLAHTTDLGERVHGTLSAWLSIAERYHEFAGRFFAVAAQPGNPLSPFSAANHAARDAEIGLWDEVLAGSSTKISAQLRAHLPELLWLYQLGIVVFWVHDSSPGLRRTSELVARSAPLVTRLIRLSRLPTLGPVVRQAADLAASLRAH
ncbi:MAG: TetR family transcriptional regulator [Pseudonocardia sp.]|nr:TetR family transcriptional regulator [Pseudonocardia sp.]